MLRLWPKKIVVGLFPQHCWLRAGKRPLASMAMPDTAGLSGMLGAFDALLTQYSMVLNRGDRLIVTVSDTMAAIAGLPWQEAIRTAEELDVYARICFEKMQCALGEGWVLQSQFRHYQAMGLAYALPVAWLEPLDAIARAHGVRLESVMPVSAVAFGRYRRPRAGCAALLLHEASKINALVIGPAGVLDFVMEPGTRNPAESARRLLLRLSGFFDVTAITTWSASEPDSVDWAGLTSQTLPQAVFRSIAQDEWS